MADDHLDKEISVSGKLTTEGIEAKAKSRTVAAIDRLLGNVVDRWNAPLESKTAEIRAKSAGRIKLIEAMSEMGSARLRNDPDFAARAIELHLEGIATRLENRESVVAASLEELRHRPPGETEANSGPEKLDSAFIERFERYAESATTEQLRERWGRVLAAEIRKPGTCSNKVMRIIDEIDGEAAKIFERTCTERIDNTIPKSLIGELNFYDKTKLVDAGLLVDPNFGHIRFFQEFQHPNGEKMWLGHFGEYAISISHSDNLDRFKNKGDTIKLNDNIPAIPIYLLTEAGHSIANILEDKQRESIHRYANILSNKIFEAVKLYHRNGDTFTLRDLVVPQREKNPDDPPLPQ